MPDERLAGRRILVFTDMRSDGGGGRYADYLFRMLDRAGAEATLVSASPSADWSGLDSLAGRVRRIDVAATDADLINVLQAVPPEFPALVADSAPDLVVFSDSCCVANLGPRAFCVEAGLSTLFVEHNCNPRLLDLMKDDHRARLASVVAAARGTLTVSRFGAATLIEVFGYPSDRVRVVFNPVLDAFFAPRDATRRTRVRSELGVGESEILLLSSAHVLGYKGVAIYLDFIVTYARQLRTLGCRFVWAGDGAQLADMRELAHLHGVGDRVAFVGHRSDMPALLDAADGFLHTAVDETFGIAVAEAMAKGLPVLAFATGGVPEVVGAAGVLAPVGADRTANTRALFAGLLHLLGDPDGYGTAARERAASLFRLPAFEEATAAALADAL